MGFFSYESKFSQVLLKLSTSCLLNVLWVLCSIPVFTIGASTTALYSVTLKMADNAEHNIIKQFFESFRRNFIQATRLWLILLAAGAVLGFDGYIAGHMRTVTTGVPAVHWTLNLALIIGAAVVYVIILTFTFPLLSRFDNTDAAMLKNAFLLGVRYLFLTITVAALHFIMFYAIVVIFTPLAIFGEGLVALIASYLMIGIIHVIEYRQEEKEEEEE